MKKSHFLPSLTAVLILASGIFFPPSELFGQSSFEHTKGIQPKGDDHSSHRGPVVTFSIPFGSNSVNMMNLLILDLPQGASLQYNGDGIYQINNMPDEYKLYNIKLRTGGDILNGVTTQDISLIQRHILGNGALANEYKHVAADVNCDGRISVIDLVEIRRAILGNINKFGCDTNYTFVPNTLQFEWTGTTIDLGEFIPVKLGDVNGNAAANSEN